MSDRELITEYKHTILELTQEKKDLNKLIEEKDAKIKKILIQLQAFKSINMYLKNQLFNELKYLKISEKLLKTFKIS